MATADCPRYLYKYFAPERVDVLWSTKLRFSPLGAFNDPFEGRPEVTGLAPDTEVLQIIESVLPEQIQAMHDALPIDVRAALPISRLLPLLLEQLRPKHGEMLAALRSLTVPAVAFIQRKFDEQIGALCLSEQPDSLLMWSHYASSHSGFAIEFDAHHDYFWTQRSTEDELRHLRRVVYKDTRPSANLSEFDGVAWFFVKSSHWSYEREWRMLHALSEAEQTIAGESLPICLFGFPPSAVTAVILGSRISESIELQVRAAVNSNGKYRAAIKRAVADSTHFHLNILGTEA